ncbi:MAG: extracellular solute-binding protein [Lachnospiraceae bacterium]|nr:extracellular solute-binding protein [Lachnospiraceae bacterium]
MKKVRKRISMFAVIILLAFMLWYAMEDSMKNEDAVSRTNGEAVELNVWYADEKMQTYIDEAAKSFEKKNNIKVNTKLISEIDYIEMINDNSVGEEFQGPDVYLVTNDQLEKVELAGLTKKVEKHKKHYSSENYCDTALHAVRYNGEQIAYPISFETSFLLYNKDYVQVEKTIEAEDSGEEIPEQAQTEMVSVVPKTIEELKEFSDIFEGAEGVENIFRFDVSDIFYTYFFVGDYLTLGGSDGDNAGVVDIDNDNVKECLTVFQELAQFFAIDIKTINYETVLNEFAQGKTVYTIGKTDAVKRIGDIAAESGKEINYGVAALPNVSDTLTSKALSVTTVAVVNGYTRHEHEADKFADYLAFGYADKLYETTGKYAAKREVVTGENSYRNEIYSQYENSVSLPKLLNASNFWVNLEIAFFNIWTGEEIEPQIQTVSEQVKDQLNN